MSQSDPIEPNTIVEPKTTKATHWISKGVEFEHSEEFPVAEPEDAARIYLREDDIREAHDDALDDLLQGHEAEITLRGCYLTTEPFPEDEEPFEGYETGCEYWKYTGETKVVKLTLTVTVEDA